MTPYTYAWSGPSSFSATTKDISGLAIGTYVLTITDANNCSSTLTSAALTQPDAYSIKVKLGQNVNCYNGKDGSASVGSIGGASPYAYSWSNGSSDSVLTALRSGKYVVNAIDANGCKTKDSISITQPANVLNVFGNVTDTRACAGTPSGKIDVEVDNATGAITYTWTGPTSIGNIKSPSNLAAGDYTLSITDAAGCIASMSKTVGKATALTVTATGQSKTCATLPDGSAYAVVSGGVAPYNYVWSTKDTTQSIKGLNTDTYTVQVTDANGCTASDATTLTDPLCDLPVAVSDVFVSTNGTVLTNSIAINDSDSLYAPTDLNFQLLNLPDNNQGSIVASLNGDFVFTPTVDYNGIVNLKYLVSNPLNLSAKATFRIYVSKITITDTVINSTCTAGGEINLTVHGGFPGYTYAWTGPDNFISTKRSVKALAPGSYEVSITDSVGSNITKTYLITDDCKVTGSSTIYISGTSSYIYNALPQGPKTYTKYGSTGAVSFVYAGVSSTTYATSATMPSMPGNYKAIATLAGDGINTAATSTDFFFTIEKAPLTITANDMSVYYGDPITAILKAGAYFITGFVGADSDSVITGKVTFTTNYTEKTTSDEVGIIITPVTTALTADKYTFKSIGGNITIKNVIAIRPLPPKVNNAKFIIGNIANPKTLRELVSVIPLNTVPVWCDITTNLCDSVAPSLPGIVGKYVYALKSIDTLSHLYSAEYVYDTVILRPPAPTVIDSTYIKGVIDNPINISIQVKGMYGSEINYFINNIKQRVIPNLPSSIGVFNYAVIQIVNSIESDTSKFSIIILNPNDIVHLQKIVDTGVLQTNSTFNFKFTFIVNNLTNYPMSHVVISDNLQNSVPITSDFNIVSNNSTGGIVSNLSFNGNSTINLTDTSSKVLSNKADTSSLVINIIPKGYVGSLTNVANVKVDTKWGTVNMISSADNKAIETTKRPTPYTIKDLQIVIPEGFSPNYDGINDKFVIIKPYDVTIDLEVFNRWGNIVYKSTNYKNDWDGKGTNNFIGQDLISGGYYYIIKATNYNGGTKIFNGYIIIQR
jgi:gliding motility-associated-like protein